jgi:hypothetical protein
MILGYFSVIITSFPVKNTSIFRLILDKPHNPLVTAKFRNILSAIPQIHNGTVLVKE